MSIESDFFRKTSFDFDRLREDGVREDDQGFHLTQAVMEGRFRAELVIRTDALVTGSLIECDLEEEYLPLRVESQKGSFVFRVRAAYLAFLGQVAARYGKPRCFVSEQLCRICDWIYEAFGERPDFPFKRGSEAAVFRNQENRKWYLLAILRKGEKEEIVNVKVDKGMAPLLCTLPGFFPAYHMHKQNWVSIRMDGSVDEALVKDLIRESRAMTHEKIEDKGAGWKRHR